MESSGEDRAGKRGAAEEATGGGGASPAACGERAAKRARRREDGAGAAADAAGVPEWGYVGKRVLAPMVRINMLPFRLLAAEHGADIVYSEELIDRKLINCVRTAGGGGGGGPATVDFWLRKPGGDDPRPNAKTAYPVLRTVPGERLVVQIGTGDAVRALRAAEVVARDVRAVDINMGCPKHFSISGGMGAALLSDPERVRDIMTTLRRNLNVPVTCKIRVLPDLRDTVELARIIESCGVAAFAVHARRREDRPRHRPLHAEVREVKLSVGCPVIYNGDCFRSGDFDALREATGCDSVMAARGAQWNASIFAADPSATLPVWDVARRYAEISREYRHMWRNSKYALVAMFNKHVGKSPQFNALNCARTADDLWAAVEGMGALPEVASLPYNPPGPNYERRPQEQQQQQQA